MPCSLHGISFPSCEYLVSKEDDCIHPTIQTTRHVLLKTQGVGELPLAEDSISA